MKSATPLLFLLMASCLGLPNVLLDQATDSSVKTMELLETKNLLTDYTLGEKELLRLEIEDEIYQSFLRGGLGDS